MKPWEPLRFDYGRDRTEEAKQKHAAAVQAGLLDPAVPVIYKSNGLYEVDYRKPKEEL